MTVQETVWNFLKNKNLNDKSISAVMGNIEQESHFDVDIIEGGNGIGFGLCQWSYGRRTQLESYGTDLNHQLEFLWSELSGENLGVTGASYQWIDKTGYLSHEDFMSGNGYINELTSAFCFCWERPSEQYANLQYRQTSANTYFEQFNGTGGGGETGGGYVKLIYPYWFGSNVKISYTLNKFLLLTTHGNVVRIKNELTNRTYYVNKSSIKIV